MSDSQPGHYPPLPKKKKKGDDDTDCIRADLDTSQKEKNFCL